MNLQPVTLAEETKIQAQPNKNLEILKGIPDSCPRSSRAL